MNFSYIHMLGAALPQTSAEGGTVEVALIDINLWLVCLNAFAAVIVLLSLLAIGMRILTWLLPEPAPAPQPVAEPDQTDAALIGSVVAAAGAAVPGGRVTHIQETTPR